MVHRADVYRPTIQQATTQQIESYSLFTSGVPCFIQPYTVQEAFYYEQRGQAGIAALYTTDVTTAFQRNDIFERNGQQYHVTAVKENLLYNLYRELTVYWYPENARKRLNREAY